MSPSRRQAIDDYQREIEKEDRKLQSDILLAEAKKQLDYEYGVQEYADKAAIDVSKSQTKANINVSEYAQKQSIKSLYSSGSSGSSNSSKATYNVGTKESYDSSTTNSLIKELENIYGDISKGNREQMESAIINLVDSGGMRQDIAEDALAEIDYEINYQDALKSYQDIQNQEIDMINNTKDVLWINTLKNAMDKSELTKVSNEVKKSEDILTDKLGKERYEKLLEEIQNKDDEISKMLKKRGIDW